MATKMRSKVCVVALGFMFSAVAHAEDIPNGIDAFVADNAVNIPVGKILLVRQHSAYCAIQMLSSQWSADESYAKYKSWYAPDSETRFDDPRLEMREDEVYQKQPFSIIGRLAIARNQDTIFCKKIKVKWSGAPANSAWLYLDEAGSLEIVPTNWKDIKNVDVSDKNLKWFKYGDAARYDKGQVVVVKRPGEAKREYIQVPLH